MLRVFTIILGLATLSQPILHGQLKMLETDELRMISYDFGHNYILPHAARSFHNTMEYHKKLFDYKPTEKVTFLIQDFGDYGNAGATAIPINFVSMGLSPFSYAFETSPAVERVFSMMNHELVHVVALDNSTKSDRFYQSLFRGKVQPTNDHPISMFYSYLTSPRMYAPRWYHEGIAAYVETWMNGGIGLGNGSFDEMVFRTLTLENSHIYSAQGLESEGVTSDFQGRSNSYLYGTRFMGYLAYHYSPEKIIEWVKRDQGSKAFFAGNFKKIFDLSMKDAWKNWISFERNWQQQNIETLQEFPLSKTTTITDKEIGSVSYAHYDQRRNKVYVAVNYPGQFPHLAAIDLGNGKVENLTDIKGPALFYVSSLTYDEQSDVIYFTSDNNAWRDLNRYHISTGKTEMLQQDFRTGDLTFNELDKSIWGIKHLNGLSTIVKIPKTDPKNPSSPLEYSSWEQKYTLPYGQDIFDIDISPDGKRLSAAVSDLSGKQQLLLYNLMALEKGEADIDTIFDFDIASPQNFRFTKDGKYLYGTSYYSGVSNIFRVDTETFDIVPMSNVLTGIFRPIEIDPETLFAFEFTSKGFKPVFLESKPVDNITAIDFLGTAATEKHPVLKDWLLPVSSSEKVDLQSYNFNESEYKPSKLLKVNYAYPIIVGYKNNFGLGYKFNFSDPLHFADMDLAISFTPKNWTNHLSSYPDSLSSPLDGDEVLHFSFNGKFKSLSVNAAYNEANFYDLFGPTIHSRKGVSLGLEYEKTLIWDLPVTLDLIFGIDGFYGLEQSPYFQTVSAQGFDDSFFLDLHAEIIYTNLKKSLGGVESEKGWEADIRGNIAQSGGKYFPSLVASLDYGFQLPIKHSSIWFRTSAGTSFDESFNPFTRFGFAAFGNNYVDYKEYKRYRSGYSFPGIGFNESINIIARDYAKVTAEWVLPPIRFRKAGGFNFYANWVQASAFTSILTINEPSSGMNQYANVGAQLDVRMVAFSHLPVTLSLGFANAWDLDTSKQYREWMISLKILD